MKVKRIRRERQTEGGFAEVNEHGSGRGARFS